MFTINKWCLVGLIIVAGEIVTITPSNAQSHDTSSFPTNQSLVDTSIPSNTFNGSLNSDTGILTIEGLSTGGGSQITLSPDVIQAINDLIGLGANSSETVTICLSDPCVPSGESTKAISLKELAKLMEEDLQKSLNDLAAAEASEKNASGRRFVRRRSTDCINPVVKAREIVAKKLAENQQFVEQIEKLNPNNNVW